MKMQVYSIRAKSVADIKIAKSVPNFRVFLKTAELKMEENESK